jgi:hypothetical protein
VAANVFAVFNLRTSSGNGNVNCSGCGQSEGQPKRKQELVRRSCTTNGPRNLKIGRKQASKPKQELRSQGAPSLVFLL